MAALVERQDVKDLLRLEASNSEFDTWFDAAILSVSESYQGGVNQANLFTGSAATELYDGTGTSVLFVKRRPVTAFGTDGVVIEDESAIDETDDSVFRFKSNGELWLRGGRRWTAPRYGKVRNVSITYVAGYASIAAFAIGEPDGHSLILQTVKQWFIDDRVDRPDLRGVASISHAGGSIGYFDAKTFSSPRWYRDTWLPIVKKHKRRHPLKGSVRAA